MSYPLYAELYEIDGAIYRRPPYRGATTQDNNKLPVDAGDTADLYDDDDYEEEEYNNDDGPNCGVGQIPAEAEVSKPEPSKVHANSFTSPPPGFGPPPGLVPPPGTSSGVVTGRPSIPRPPVNGKATADERVTQEGDRRWTASTEVDPKFHGMLIGAKGRQAKEMESATQCRIIFPGRDSKSPLIRIVSSAGQENVSRCLDRIEALVITGIKSGHINKTPTHFAAIPCVDPWVRQRFLTFKELMMTSKDVHPSCMVEALFPSKLKLHLTICMLQLQTDQEKDLGRKTMTMLKEKYAKRAPLEVRINGFDIMNDDPTEVHVLFAKVHGDGVQELVDDIKDELHKADLIAKVEKQNVKLHMTVMNSRYAARDKDGSPSTIYKDRKSFDASWIMKEHDDWDFGTFSLNRLTICTLSTEDEKTGYYECFFDETINQTS